MKKTLMILGVAALTFACNEATEANQQQDTEENTSAESDQSENDQNEISENDEAVEKIALEDRAYSLTEFTELFQESKEGLEGQRITVEGYYMNHNKQKDANAGEDEYQYNVTLYKDESFNRDDIQAFFIMKSSDENQFDGIKQKDKITVTGTITGDKFFSAPLLEDGELSK